MTPDQVAPVDTGNGLLSEVPAQVTTALMQTPHGQRLALTVRTASTTLTVLLPGSSEWVAVKGGEAFEVPENASFKLKVTTLTDYCCSFL